MAAKSAQGVVAAGHEETASVAADILRAGGNAFDAVVAAHFAACVCEPVLASPGGGGFLLARPASDRARVYDFFVQTPQCKKPAADLGFYPIVADFGTTTQEFHIGVGAAATPGTVRGLLQIQRELGKMPLREVVAPAVALARSGVTTNDFQAYIFDIVRAIYQAEATTAQLFRGSGTGDILASGDLFRNVALADLLETLAIEGDRLFYEGEVGQMIVDQCQQRGGHLTRSDLTAYRVDLREPLSIDYHGARVHFNPPPSSGGVLIALALKLLEGQRHTQNQLTQLQQLAEVMRAVNLARSESGLDQLLQSSNAADSLLPTLVARYRQALQRKALFSRGTTHISVLDAAGNVAAMTVSNGEGCGYLVPGCGFMLNNMLGEEDLSPGGFHRWQEDVRISSMMCPTVVTLADGETMALGSGGSNRIRSAILQVLLHLIDDHMSLEEAIIAPRLHHESGTLHLEAGLPETIQQHLLREHPTNHLWPEPNLYFGGVHAVSLSADAAQHGAGDPRRGGKCKKIA